MTRFPLNFRLDAARRAIEATLVSTAQVWRKTQVPDTSGGFTDTYAVVATEPCRFYPTQITPVERETAALVQTVAFWRFVFPYTADIRSTDRLTVGTRTFEVVQAGLGSIETTLLALCQEIT